MYEGKRGGAQVTRRDPTGANAPCCLVAALAAAVIGGNPGCRGRQPAGTTGCHSGPCPLRRPPVPAASCWRRCLNDSAWRAPSLELATAGATAGGRTQTGYR